LTITSLNFAPKRAYSYNVMAENVLLQCILMFTEHD